MTCNEIENRLPAYREDLLSREEKESTERHLASCPRCSRAIADLKKAEELVHGLGEVEPPPFFEQRIMSRVKEEAAQKQGILRRLFCPLHIKIPIQVLATLIVAVLAVYVYKADDSGMKQVAPLPIPMTGFGKDRVTALSSEPLASPSAVTPDKQAPAGGLSEKSRQQFAASPFEKSGKEERIADSRAPMREDRPAAVKPKDPIAAVRENEAPAVSSEALGTPQEKTGKQNADKSLETFMPEQKRKGKMADTAAAAGESGKTMAAPSLPQRGAAAAAKRSDIDLAIRVRDTGVAIREIEARLGQVNARIIERQHSDGGEFLKAQIAAQNVPTLLDLLETVGKVNQETSLPVVPDGNVTVSIRISGHP